MRGRALRRGLFLFGRAIRRIRRMGDGDDQGIWAWPADPPFGRSLTRTHLLLSPARAEGVDYASMVALPLSNPPTILSFSAVFAGLGLRIDAGWLPAIALVVGVMLGSAAWWVAMTAVVSALRDRVTPGIIRGIGILSGLALITFGVGIITQAARPTP